MRSSRPFHPPSANAALLTSRHTYAFIDASSGKAVMTCRLQDVRRKLAMLVAPSDYPASGAWDVLRYFTENLRENCPITQGSSTAPPGDTPATHLPTNKSTTLHDTTHTTRFTSATLQQHDFAEDAADLQDVVSISSSISYGGWDAVVASSMCMKGLRGRRLSSAPSQGMPGSMPAQSSGYLLMATPPKRRRGGPSGCNKRCSCPRTAAVSTAIQRRTHDDQPAIRLTRRDTFHYYPVVDPRRSTCHPADLPLRPLSISSDRRSYHACYPARTAGPRPATALPRGWS